MWRLVDYAAMEPVELTLEEALPVRHAVLRGGRPDLSAALPQDDWEGCFHFGARDEHGIVVATSSYVPEATMWRPGRAAWRLRGMAVATQLQGSGIGRVILEAAMARLRGMGAEVLWANARDTALGFYERTGMEIAGEQFQEGPHALPHHVVVGDLVPPSPIQPVATQTENLDLRPWTLDDLDDFAYLMAIPEVTRFPWGEPFTRERSAESLAKVVEHWDRLGFGLWRASDRANGAVAGWIGLATPSFLPAVMPSVEVGWRLDPAMWGRVWRPKAGALPSITPSTISASIE